MTDILKNFRIIAEKYDVFLVDQWGVLHNGFNGFADAQMAMSELKKMGKTIIILSNSSRPYAPTAAMLTDLGYSEDLYDDIITSGTDFQQNILHRHQPFYQDLGNKCYVLSWEQDVIRAQGEKLQHLILQDMPLQAVNALAEADFILCAGINRQEPLQSYQALLQQAQSLKLPMICINPDKQSVAPDGQMHLCPGAIAAWYEEEYQGNVHWHGKPYLPVYQSAARIAGRPVDGSFLAIGDSIHHDIQGIKNAGGDGLFITSGIAWQELGLRGQYQDSDSMALQKFYQKYDIFADYAQTRLVW